MRLDAADRAAVLDLYARYANAIDSGDAVACAECFTANGVLRVGEGKPVVGRDGLRRFAVAWREAFDGVPRHLSWHVLLRQEQSDLVRGTASAALLGTTRAGTSIVFSGGYEDRFERSPDGAWLIAERLVTADIAS
jgi:ketosteroid isomerase-like protein